MYIVFVLVDGNCLFYIGSVYVFGIEKRGVEMRVCIVIELLFY